MIKKQFPRLNKEQAKLVIKKMKEELGPEITAILDKSGINPDHLVRFQYVSSLCQNTREQNNISFRQASEKLKIPQYRLKDIERSNTETIQPDILERYVDFLGLTTAFNDWKQDNIDIYESIQKNKVR